MNKTVIKNYVCKEIFLFLVGGSIYYLIEVLARGWSHWSMYLLGGLCFIIIGLLNEFYKWETLFQIQCVIGSAVITVLELLTGLLVNKHLGWEVWDYSDRAFNFMGQICLRNSIYWIFLSGVAIVLDDFIRWGLFKEQKPIYRWR